MDPNQVLCLGGAAGIGKTTAAYTLARDARVGVTQVDDLHRVVACLTTPEQLPLLHYWETHFDEAIHWPPERILEMHLSVARLLTPALRAVVDSHIDERRPMVLEGDYLLPEVAAGPWEGTVHGVFLYEPDQRQIVANFAEREPDAGEQTGRARVSWLYGQWLIDECRRVGSTALPARPFATLPQRIREATSIAC